MNLKEKTRIVKEKFLKLVDWFKEKPLQNILIATGIFLAIVVGIVLFIQFILPVLISIAIVVLAVVMFVKGDLILGKLLGIGNTAANQDNPLMIYFETLATHYMVEAISHFCNSDKAFHKIKQTEDIVDYAYWNDGTNYKYFIEKKNAVPIEEEMLFMLAYKIENRINNKLKNLITCKIVSLDGLPPVIGVVSVEDKGGRVEISVYIANDSAKRQQLLLLKQKTDKHCTPIDDKDPLFNGDGSKKEGD